VVDYQGNSKKNKVNPEAPAKNIAKVVTGEVIQKDKGLGRKFRDTFFGGDGKQVARYIGADILLPSLRNLLLDMISKGAEKMILGERADPRRDPRRVNYQAQYYLNPAPRSPFDSRAANLPSTPPRGRVNRKEIQDVILSTREDAELVVERLSDILENYEVASLADLYDLIGLPTSHLDNKWGWTFLGTVRITQVRQGYLLELPPLEEI